MNKSASNTLNLEEPRRGWAAQVTGGGVRARAGCLCASARRFEQPAVKFTTARRPRGPWGGASPRAKEGGGGEGSLLLPPALRRSDDFAAHGRTLPALAAGRARGPGGLRPEGREG